MTEKKEDIAFTKMANSICNYLKLKGWEIIVIGDTRIQQPIGSLKYNFELIFRFTGKKIKKER